MTIHKLRTNKPLTRSDLDELERMLLEAGIGDAEILKQVSEESHDLGLFVRSLVGLDPRSREAGLRHISNGQIAQRDPDRISST